MNAQKKFRFIPPEKKSLFPSGDALGKDDLFSFGNKSSYLPHRHEINV